MSSSTKRGYLPTKETPFSMTYHGASMASGYRHVAPQQRYTISVMLKAGDSQRKIASTLGVSASTISREIRCNSAGSRYDPDRAQRSARRRQAHRRRPRRFTDEVRTLIEALLAKKWSPEQIAGFSWLVGLPHVSAERMYQHIWADKKGGGGLYKHLRRRGGQRHWRGAGHERRGVIADRRMISERPPAANERLRTGD
ncbi:MAG: IS30 family transposase [Bradyrhizobiaceae bacterium]|nr:IS30 family transposase [Bradyrhizobiaceae bacterium]